MGGALTNTPPSRWVRAGPAGIAGECPKGTSADPPGVQRAATNVAARAGITDDRARREAMKKLVAEAAAPDRQVLPPEAKGGRKVQFRWHQGFECSGTMGSSSSQGRRSLHNLVFSTVAGLVYRHT